MWFEELVGFAETSPAEVRAKLSVDGETMTSSVNGRRTGCGTLERPSLAELRERTERAGVRTGGRLSLREVVGDVATLHRDPANAGAFFQAASQFNLLEMVSPSVTPAAGIAGYENDHTQGPARAPLPAARARSFVTISPTSTAVSARAPTTRSTASSTSGHCWRTMGRPCGRWRTAMCCSMPPGSPRSTPA